MKAAIVSEFCRPPALGEFEIPEAREDEVIVSVEAAALSQLVRLQASGKHYSSGQPPFVPGADGVGRLQNGQRVYFAFPRAPVGAMAEQVAVKRTHIVELPHKLDGVTAAAIANPGMSSWAALVSQCRFRADETVLINGATGASGKLAISIARHLGAARVIATGRNPDHREAMLALGADDYLLTTDGARFEQQLKGEFERGVDVVLDYLWGAPAEAILQAATGKGPGNPERRIRFVNIGALGGLNITLPAAVVRSSRLEIIGSGLGSVHMADLIQAIAGVMQAVDNAGLSIDTHAVNIDHVEEAWSTSFPGRTVFTI
ncbi:zinc-binding alcohol dehydrogenase family protein [Pseudomaricurvus alkylphenolicus]|nr:zinc-binding alcohol dehydrogenase family protein [Pseudomaricurvus alkylphenolicus]